MRVRRLVLAVACVGLIGAPPAAQAASAEDAATLHRYGAATWQSFAAMTDEDSGLPADTLHYDGTRSVQTSTTNIGAYMWSALVAEELGVISHAEVVERLGTTLTTIERLERHGRAASTTTGTTTGRARSSRVAAHGRRRSRRTSPPSTTAGSRSACARGESRRGAAGPRERTVRVDGLRLLLPARAQPDPLPLRARHGRRAVLLRHDRLREPDRELHRDREGRAPQRHYYGANRSFPDSCDFTGSRRGRSASPAPTSARDVYEGAYPTTARASRRRGAAACSRR